MQQLINLASGAATVAVSSFLLLRMGIFGDSRIAVYDDDEPGVILNRFLYHRADYKKAGSNVEYTVWSFAPITFSKWPGKRRRD